MVNVDLGHSPLTWKIIQKYLPFSILTATVTASLGLSLSMPRASAITTCPKQPSPSGLPRVNLHKQTQKTQILQKNPKLFPEVIYPHFQEHFNPDRRFQSLDAKKCCLVWKHVALVTFNRISEVRVRLFCLLNS